MIRGARWKKACKCGAHVDVSDLMNGILEERDAHAKQLTRAKEELAKVRLELEETIHALDRRDTDNAVRPLARLGVH